MSKSVPTLFDVAMQPLLDRVKAALIEAGYPEVEPWWNDVDLIPTMYTHPGPAAWCPPAVGWMAVELAGAANVPCWPCVADSLDPTRSGVKLSWINHAHDCQRGHCHHLGERRWPPPELLRPSPGSGFLFGEE